MSSTTDEPDEGWKKAWDAELRRRSEELRSGKVKPPETMRVWPGILEPAERWTPDP